MFVGHFAVGFGARALAPRASLGTLVMAAQFIDLLWPTLLLFGIESVRIEPGATAMTPLNFVYYPYSHSLAAVIAWAAGFALVYWYYRRFLREAVVLGIAVVSHWLLDAIVHRPDLPLYPGSETMIGLGLWYSLAGTLVVESSLFVGGVWLYLRATKPTDAAGTWAAWGLIAILAAIYLGSIFGEPPPGVHALAAVGEAEWLLVAWAYWIDRHRTPAVTKTA